MKMPKKKFVYIVIPCEPTMKEHLMWVYDSRKKAEDAAASLDHNSYLPCRVLEREVG
jgi:hypothetical protein